MKSVRVLREREGELRMLVERSEASQHELDIDEAVITTAPLYRSVITITPLNNIKVRTIAWPRDSRELFGYLFVL